MDEKKRQINRDINRDISARFFTAIERLKEEKVIGGLQPFAVRYGFDRRNMLAQKKDGYKTQMRPSWLFHIVKDYKVNPAWLLLGEGEFYRPGFTAEIVKNCAKPARKNED